MKDEFLYLLRVRYAECDAQQVVFNAKYVEFVDVAITEYFRLLWGDYTFITEQGLDFQVVNVTINWKAPAQFDDVVAITIDLKRIGTSSFTYALVFSNYRTKRVLATVEITYVMVSLKEHQKRAIPPTIRKQLAHGASGIVNHAGVVV